MVVKAIILAAVVSQGWTVKIEHAGQDKAPRQVAVKEPTTIPVGEWVCVFKPYIVTKGQTKDLFRMSGFIEAKCSWPTKNSAMDVMWRSPLCMTGPSEEVRNSAAGPLIERLLGTGKSTVALIRGAGNSYFVTTECAR